MNKIQNTFIQTLKKEKLAYPHKVPRINFEETHISWILLTGQFAYKIKKDLKFGKVLNFSSLELRKKFCQKEVQLNKILCGDMYQGIVKIVNDKGTFKISDLRKKGKALEYAVKMREIPQKNRMDLLLHQNKINTKTIDRLVDILIDFHKKTPTNKTIKKFGQSKFILAKINENFRTLETLDKINPIFEKKLISFVKNNKDFFLRRIKENKIRNVHGDLYLKNIFVLRNTKFYLYDRIEFNDELRFADIAEDVAHFAMDLDFHNKKNLRKYFINQYIKKSKDSELESLVYFWMCYKACMRVKVSLFQAKNEQDKKKKNSLLNDAKKLLKLTSSYLNLF
ncbi:MAG: hypothetical protein OER78_04815 [Nitrosopumilus sp.]|nr:hypothetical protein [Nitrosopumilus sp.]